MVADRILSARSRDETFLGATPRARWSFALGVLVIAVFSEGWLKALGGGGTEPADSALIRLMYYPGYLAGFALIALAPWRALAAAVRTPLLWALVGFALVSAIWSIDPGATHRRALAVLLCSLAGLAVASQLSWTQLSKALALCFVLLSLASFVTAAFLPGFGRMKLDFPGAWDGLFIEKNGLGAAAAQTVVFCAAAFVVDRPRRWAWAAGAALGAGLLVMSGSKTSLLVGVFGCMAFAFAWLVRRGPATAVAASFLAVVGVGAMAFAIAFSPEALLGLLGKDATLTGRTRIWSAVLRQIATRPHTGFGYGAVWSDKTGWGPVYWVVKQYGARPTYAHNGYIDLWLGVGDYAVWVFAALLIVTWIATIAVTYRRSDACVALPCLAMFTLNNCTESSILWYNSIGWVLFVIVAAKVMIPDRAPAFARTPARPRSLAPAGPESTPVLPAAA